MFNEPYFLPFILCHDYEAFRRLNTQDFPDTYNEWLDLHTKEKLARGQVGYLVKEIQVNSNDFAQHCSAHSCEWA